MTLRSILNCLSLMNHRNTWNIESECCHLETYKLQLESIVIAEESGHRWSVDATDATRHPLCQLVTVFLCEWGWCFSLQLRYYFATVTTTDAHRHPVHELEIVTAFTPSLGMVALSSDGCRVVMHGTFTNIGPIVFSQELGVIMFRLFSPLTRT